SIARGIVNTPFTSASLMCSVTDFVLPPLRSIQLVPLRPRFAAALTAPRIVSFAHSSPHGLYQPVHPVVLPVISVRKPEFRLSRRRFSHANRQAPAQVIFNKRCLVARLLAVPRVHAQYRTIARSALRPARRR